MAEAELEYDAGAKRYGIKIPLTVQNAMVRLGNPDDEIYIITIIGDTVEEINQALLHIEGACNQARLRIVDEKRNAEKAS